ncbi:MAG: hypothetical protein M1818_003690 [Claussenomyces sp. TS43310]|nr:MAG: hypothetical protein M1818_003690 [Claussenomyces sp. TS43310]
MEHMSERERGSIWGEKDFFARVLEQTGFGYMRIKRTDALDVLLKAVHKADISVHYNKRLTIIEDHKLGVTVTFSDGTTDTADLLLGCNGIHSYVRCLYVDPPQSPIHSGNAGLSSIIPASILSESVA